MSSSGEGLGEQIVELLPRLRRFARALARSVDDADDLVQIAIERALARSDQLRPNAPLSSWLFGILRNAWIDECRARARRRQTFLPEVLGEQVADATAHPNESTASVEQAMMRLPEDQREVIALILIDGLSYKEATEVLGVPMGTVTSRLARGREALQQMLDTPEGTRS